MKYQLKKPSWLTPRNVENACTVVLFLCAIAAVPKLTIQQGVQTHLGVLPIWQAVAGVLGAGVVYILFNLIDGGSK
jgi:hypothetical protein